MYCNVAAIVHVGAIERGNAKHGLEDCFGHGTGDGGHGRDEAQFAIRFDGGKHALSDRAARAFGISQHTSAEQRQLALRLRARGLSLREIGPPEAPIALAPSIASWPLRPMRSGSTGVSTNTWNSPAGPAAEIEMPADLMVIRYAPASAMAGSIESAIPTPSVGLSAMIGSSSARILTAF